MSQPELSIYKSHWKVWVKEKGIIYKGVSKTAWEDANTWDRWKETTALGNWRCSEVPALCRHKKPSLPALQPPPDLCLCLLSVFSFKGYRNSLLWSFVLIGFYSPRLWNWGLSLSSTEVSEPEMNRISFGLAPNFSVEGNGNLNAFYGLFSLSEQ